MTFEIVHGLVDTGDLEVAWDLCDRTVRPACAHAIRHDRDFAQLETDFGIGNSTGMNHPICSTQGRTLTWKANPTPTSRVRTWG